MTRRYAVVGNPVCHSSSPWLHGCFARLTQRDVVYAAVCPPAGDRLRVDGFAAFAESFFRGGGCGLNITAPFKGDALAFAARASDFAVRAGAANVLARRDGEVVAYNTDGSGFLRAIGEELPDGVRGKKVLLLGAGGAARAVATALAEQQPAALWIYNRTAARAVALADAVGGEVVDDCPAGADIVINALSSSPDGAFPPAEVFADVQLACDLSYGAAAADFLQRARDGGARRAIDGSGMLAWQAAMSFAIWEGTLPSVSAILSVLRQSGRRVNAV